MAKRSDSLSTYNAKRDFARTAEPRGKAGWTGKTSRRFIVQKHDATRLHYDFRLEMDGVLKSWAVTRGPSASPEDKRLAVRTEDHPLSYATFEGTIPAGEYGGGTVMLWDVGEWAPIEGKDKPDPNSGHLHIILQGQRMKGEWILVRLKPRGKERQESWLLRKVEDEFAGGSDDLVTRHVTSVSSGRTMAEIAAGKAVVVGAALGGAAEKEARPKRAKRRGSTQALPAFVEPQLATLTDAVPTGQNWLHEIKFDGYRALAAVAGEKARLSTRSGLDWTEPFAPVAEALAAMDLPSCLIDGEVVALDAAGNPDFSALQAALRDGAVGGGLHYFAFDLLSLAGEDLRALSLVERKARLATLLAKATPPIHLSDHVIGAGEQLFAAMCAAGQEGIVAKRADAPYRSGRTQGWLKVKCILRQEFVIVGWTKSSSRGRAFASLLLAQHEDGRLSYKGKVGTGFGSETMATVAARMKPLARDNAPLELPSADAKSVQWIEPQLVAEVAFAEFTADGRVRHGSFVGLREDKPAAEVTPERARAVVAEEDAAPLVAISNRDRIVFPEAGFTKGQLADYYLSMAPVMLPEVARRPLSLVRCPQGRARQCFFQKHDSGAFGEAVHKVPIREKDGASEEYLYVEDSAGLQACVQMGTIEFHGWGTHVDDVERPDRLVFDLDPDPGVDYADVRSAATDIRDRLADLGLTSFAMLSGGKGIHIIAPLTRGHDWEVHKDFSRRFALALAMAEPDRYIATASKAKRKGLIFIDWLRNQRGATAIMPWSVRSRPGAPVATPVSWNELGDIERPDAFSMKDVEALLERAGSADLAHWCRVEQALPDM